MKSKSNFKSGKGLIKSENEKLVVPEEFKGLFGSVNLPESLNEKEEIRKILKSKHS
ncbi:hypothetical protein [Algoriphagus sp.]|uniref:hypothetical protein n=1 Tax=Algoriphagus sp. TaxID=1872435 RepID=UPI00391A2ACC